MRAPIAQEGGSFEQSKVNSNPDTFDKSVGNTRSSTSVGIKDTINHIEKPNWKVTERMRRSMTTVVWCPGNQAHIPWMEI